MDKTKIIKDTIDSLIFDRKLFTSLDVSNLIKSKGHWIRNRDVAYQLNVLFDSNYCSFYKRININVIRKEDLKNVSATLYLPNDANADDYKNLEGEPISPDSFNLSFPSVSTTDVYDNSSVIDSNVLNNIPVLIDKNLTDLNNSLKFTKSKRYYNNLNIVK